MEVADEQRVDFLLPGMTSGLELEYPTRLVQPSAWIGHIPFALWLIGALKPRMVVELGVHTGNSYCAFLQAVHTLGLETRSYGIDHWRGDEHAGHYGDEVYNELKAYHDPLYGTFSTLLRSSFEEALPYFSEGSVDLLHIDGFHTYDAVSADFQSWLPKVSSRGVALFHDINVRERGFGIWQFWEELTERYPHFEFLHSHGLGIVYLGGEPLIGPLKALFAEKTAGQRDRIQSYFSRLGTSVVERFEIQDALKSGKADRKKGRAAALEAELSMVRLELGETKRDLEAAVALEAELSMVRSELGETKRALEAAMLQARIKDSMTRQRPFVTARLQRELIVANRQKDSWHAETARLHQELHAANLERNSWHKERGRLHEELHAANLERNSWHAERGRLHEELHAANLERNSWHAERGRLHEELHAANLENTRRQRRVFAANLERDSSHAEAVRLQHELLRITFEKDACQRQLGDVLQSRSWWLTKPLRWVNAAVRRPRPEDGQPDEHSRTAVTKS